MAIGSGESHVIIFDDAVKEVGKNGVSVGVGGVNPDAGIVIFETCGERTKSIGQFLEKNTVAVPD